MRNQRNFRGQSGLPQSFSLNRESPLTCVCQISITNDYTGEEQSFTRICVGTATNGVVDCSCCEMRRAEYK